MTAGFVFKLGERIKEVDLARWLSTSLTPLRKALNQSSTEGF